MLYSCTDLNKKNIGLAIAIFDLFPPTTFTTNKRWMTAKKDGQDSCIKFISTYSEIETELLKTQAVCNIKAIPMHPMIYIITKHYNKSDNTYKEVEDCVVAFNEIRFRFKNFLYPPQSAKFWTFLDLVFYSNKDVPTKMKSIVQNLKK